MRIVRNDITKMNTEAIVNTANSKPIIGSGCDTAIYEAAGREELLKLRQEIGTVEPGDSFVTPGFNLPCKYIIHTVSPLYKDGNSGEETILRNCYKSALAEALKLGIRSISFPLISSGSFGYPKNEAIRIAADEINLFSLNNPDMDIVLVVFDFESASLGFALQDSLEEYISNHYVKQKLEEEYAFYNVMPSEARPMASAPENKKRLGGIFRRSREICDAAPMMEMEESKDLTLDERLLHLSDTFSQYLLYLIESKGFKNSDVYTDAWVDKKLFSKIKNNPNYHTEKLTALCLCVGLKLNLDETRDLLARAGYALSPSDKTDVIFSYFIEEGHYDMVDIEIALEKYGQKCILG